MKRITKLADLEEFGIVPLTGEACSLGYRILCDVTEEGKELIKLTFGLSNVTLHPNWNRGTSAAPHIGSIMLPFQTCIPLGVFALLKRYGEVWVIYDQFNHPSSVMGLEKDDYKQEWKEYLDNSKTPYTVLKGSVENGARNVHQMSGRIV